MYWKKSRYANVGTDCGCGDPCSCDCPTIISWQQESESRNCELCGHAEYSGYQSTPRRYYRLRSWSGQYAFTFSEFGNRHEQNYSGFREYSAVDCTISGSLSGTFTHLRGGNEGCAGEALFPENSQHVTMPIGSTQAKLRFRAWSGSAWNYCHDNPFPTCETCSDSGLETLSVEDTEEDAIDRATPTSGTSSSSVWEMRTTGRYFLKRTASYAYLLGNVRPNATYRVTPAMRRRTRVGNGVGFGEWEDVEVEPEDFYISPSDPAYDEAERTYELPRVELPHVQGWEYALASGATVEFVDDV